ncbi:error-prone DNA polymerase [Motiliproteus sediminis]|uniref:error-prone DNA polymerase n=1 Tax=Motiliproteus sediminis TaxID=1468178 RepID=UPI001AEFC5C3|nr:error-prone DNA polymerase [Motiliproteus sediminis]
MKAVAYAELHAISNFTFLRGASHPHELVRRAAELGYRAIALTDECSVAGVVRAWEEARTHSIKLIVGSEFRLQDQCVVLLAPDRRGYAQLCTLISRCRRRADKGHYQIDWHDLHQPQLLDHCLWLIGPATDPDLLEPHLRRLRDHHDGRLWLLLERDLAHPDDARHYARRQRLAIRLRIPTVAAGNVHMHHPGRQPLQDILTAIRLGTSVQQAGFELAANGERHLRSAAKLRRLFTADELTESIAIAARCQFDLSELRYEYPAELVPAGSSAADHLRQRVEQGARLRFADGVSARLRNQIEHELALISELRYEHYFLTIEDIVRYARGRGILCQGRGSAANSIVCYCLHITEVDPREVSLLVERFISRERNEPPDIDVDFEHERREEVIQYIYRRYGRERAGLAATVISYRAKSAIRDVGKALGYDQSYLAWLIAQLDRRDSDHPWQQQLAKLGGSSPDPRFGWLCRGVSDILGFPRHLSQHVGGFVIAATALSELVPIENAAMPERTLIQWNKDDLEALGLLKVDILALGMLTAIRKSLALLSEQNGQALSIQSIPREDPATYEMLCQADSMGVFQVESRAQMNMLPRLQPRNYYDLVIQVAIVRPGPIQGDMVHPYLKRRQGLEAIDYPTTEVRAVLERTLGVPIFQEQVIRLAMVAAGFSGGEADQLRRAMAAWRRSGSIARYQQQLTDGMLQRGYPLPFAQRLCRQIEGFGEYGFPESHAASFALLVYLSAWLKRHHPAAFCCGLLNSQPMGFYSPSQLVQDAQRHGVNVRPVCINHSHWDCTLETDHPSQPILRLGLRLIRGFSRQAAEQLCQQRPPGGFATIATARRALSLAANHWDALAAGGALDILGQHRFQARWELLTSDTPMALDVSAPPVPSQTRLPPPSEYQCLSEDYRHLGLSLGRHPLALLRERGLLPGAITAAGLPRQRRGQLVQVAGLVTNRQRPSSAADVTFVTLEDETGQINLVVWKATAQAQRQPLLNSHLLKVDGTLEKEGQLIHILAGRLTDISPLWSELAVRSRDFQ